MAQRTKMLSPKPMDMNSTPETLKVERKTNSSKFSSTFPLSL